MSESVCRPLCACVCICMCAGMNGWAEQTSAKDKNSHSTPHPSLSFHVHMAPGSLARTVAMGVASDHLGGYWMAMAAFCNNLARSKFIRVKFGPGCSAVVPIAFGPAALCYARPSFGAFLLDPERAISGCLWWWLCSPVSNTDSCLWMIWAITLFTQAME